MATKSSSEYWREREEEQRRHDITDESEYRQEVERIFRQTMFEIQKEISDFYVKYAKKEGITLSEAKRRVKRLDMQAYSEKAAEYVKNRDFSAQADAEMRLYNLTMKVNRLEMLKAELGMHVVGAYDQIDKYFEQKLSDRTLAEFNRQAGILGDTVQANGELINSIVNASFHNATFSERIWGQYAGFKSALDREITRGLIQGIGSEQLASNIRKTCIDVSSRDALRLMVTEMARVRTDAAKLSMEKNGNKEYEFMALGRNPCPVCQNLNGKIFKVKDLQPGENAPPMHPWCHCATAPHWDEATYQAWLDSGAAKAGVPYGEFEKNGGIDDINTGIRALNKESKSGKINPENIPMSQAIKEAKTHEELGGILKSLGCVNIEGLETIPLESAKYLSAGMQRANELFGQRIITLFEVRKKMQNYGEHHAVPSSIIIGRKRAEEDPIEAFFTALHESAHDYDHSRSSGVDNTTAYDYSSKVVKKALGNLGLTMQKKNGQKLIYEIYSKWDKKDCSEVFAKAVEYVESGRGNPLAKEIMRMLEEGEMP